MVGNAVGSIIHYNSRTGALKMRSLSENSKKLMLKIHFDDTRNGCCCACCLDGCSPLTAF